MLKLNTMSPSKGSKKARKRVGRGAASGWGKTCGRGHKGQKSRAGGGVKSGFEGGQMPLQMRLPKFGFKSRVSEITASIRLSDLNKCKEGEINLKTLIEAGLVRKNIKRVKVFLSGEIDRVYNLLGIKVTKGARESIEKVGGSVN